MLRKFLDDEADLGSDNEDNDDMRKDIDENDEEENEDGLDKDLEGFVAGDDEEIGDATEEMMNKFRDDMDKLDEEEYRRTYEAVMLGKNRKRKRQEVDGLDIDNNSKRKLRLIESRINQIRNGEVDDDEIDFGKTMQQKVMEDEEEMSEEEVQKLIEQEEYIRMKKTVQSIRINDLERYNSLKQKEKV